MRYIGKKLLRILLVVWAVTAITFLLVTILPGDVAYFITGPNTTLNSIQAVQKELGLDRSLVTRYFSWLSHVTRGHLGVSPITLEPVLEAIVYRLPVTVELMLLAQCLALALALPAAIFSAYKPRSLGGSAVNVTAFATMSVPVFIMAILLIYLFALKLKWLPATGYVPLQDGFWLNLKSMFMPAVSIALVEWVVLMRVLRNDLMTTLKENYILMARSKGLPASRILFRHALRPSLFTLITIIGMQMGHLIGGALIVESIFALPGIGRLLVTAIYGRDFLMIQGCMLFITLSYVVINAMVDLCYYALDPRIRRAQETG